MARTSKEPPSVAHTNAARSRSHSAGPTCSIHRLPLLVCLATHPCPPAQDDAKEEHTTTELLTRVPVEEILEAKKADEEARKAKAAFARHLRKTNDQWDMD